MMYATQYLILGAYAGMTVYLLNVFRNVIIYIFEKKGKNINCVGFLFIVISLYMAIVQYRNIYGILSACTSVVNIIFMMQNNVVKLKVGQMIASSIWIIYDIILQAYVAGVSEIIIVFAATSWILENKYNKSLYKIIEDEFIFYKIKIDIKRKKIKLLGN